MRSETEEEMFKRLTRDARAEARREQQRDIERRKQRKVERRQKREQAAQRVQLQHGEMARRHLVTAPKVVEVRRRGIMAKPRKRMCLSGLEDANETAVEGGHITERVSVPARCDIGTAIDPESPGRLLARVDAAIAQHMSQGEECGCIFSDEVQKEAGAAERCFTEGPCVAESATPSEEPEMGVLTDWEDAWRQASTKQDQDSDQEVAAWTEYMP